MGVPCPRSGGYPISGLGGTPSQVWMGSTPSQVWGGTPSQVWMVGVPHPGLDGGTPWLGLYGREVPRVHPHHQDLAGVPPTLGWGTPNLRWSTPHHQDLTGVPPTIKTWPGYPHPGMGYPPRQSSIASTCYAVGGMPLAFMQEDFLVRAFLHRLTTLYEIFGDFYCPPSEE